MSDATNSGPSFAPGAVIAGRFRLDARIGEGGMAVVWSATHLVTRKPIALKILKRSDAREKDAAMRLRFVREARAACAVRHPNVVAIHDVLELEDGSPVLVMDLLEGETLGRRVERDLRLPLAEVARIMLPVVSAVGAAHALGIIHRDLKPDNIFLVAEGEGRISVKVLDFGIAKLTALEGDAALTGAMTGTGAILGTPYYMSPEQIFGERDIDVRSDVWSVGVILYELISGRRPTHAESIGQVLKVITRGGILPLREVAVATPNDVADLVDRMLSRERGDRPPDLREAQTVLRRHIDAAAGSNPEPTIPSARSSTDASTGDALDTKTPEPQLSRLASTRANDGATLEATVADPAASSYADVVAKARAGRDLSPVASPRPVAGEGPPARPRVGTGVIVGGVAVVALGALVTAAALGGRGPSAGTLQAFSSSAPQQPVQSPTGAIATAVVAPMPPSSAVAEGRPVAVVDAGAAVASVASGASSPSVASSPSGAKLGAGAPPRAHGSTTARPAAAASGSAPAPSSAPSAAPPRVSGGVIETAPF